MNTVDPLVVEMILGLPTTPAFVANELFDVLASNPIARAVTPKFAVGMNLARAAFIDPLGHEGMLEWDRISDHMVGLLKENLATSADVLPLERLLSELASGNSGFTGAWASAVIPVDYVVALTMDHPKVGRMAVTYQPLRLPATGQTLVLGNVEPGSESEERLFRLAATLGPVGS
ncbi:MmyB family transcriptional regulator [Subtercola boreus]|uniref:MmyB-like transcription regulator ligand binding domain-containing protein n=1 Tax=Subtercola boreus TaxID=120213 RepID=A0A3E0WB11_9MICO|nr:hypothetical protein [Subtercola boreus]RFA20068.1 hypothetical protein B7R24_10875 [Subtercola boreus]RFA20198.1 hypothetical protein B7R23_10815 [Subtercola boreus]RFA26524.1 hypothetical protein B7R25_10940 [Subtercola boreus]